MNQLMTAPVALTMTSREIADLTGKEHGNVMRDIRVLVSELQASNLNPVFKTSTYPGLNGQDYPQYELDKDTTLALLLGYDAAARFRVGKRWQELEAGQGPKLPQTMAQALRLAAEQAEALEQQKLQLLEAAPKVEFVDQFVRSNGSKGFRAVCKLLNAKEPEFRLFLVDKKIMYRLGSEWMPYQQHIDAGRFEVKAGVAHLNEHAYNRALFTPKGVNWVAAEWAKHRVALVVAGKAVAV